MKKYLILSMTLAFFLSTEKADASQAMQQYVNDYEQVEALEGGGGGGYHPGGGGGGGYNNNNYQEMQRECEVCPYADNESCLHWTPNCVDDIDHELVEFDTQCGDGYYLRLGVCTQCPAGKYKAGTDAATSCAQCPAGTYSAAGASTCTPCSAGYYSAAGASSCSKCTDGTYSAAGASSCLSCIGIAISNGSCSTCGTDGSCSAVSCRAGYIPSSSKKQCTACSAGTYAKAGDLTCSDCSTISIAHGSCTACTTTGICTERTCADGYQDNGTKCLRDFSANLEQTLNVTFVAYEGSVRDEDTAVSCPEGLSKSSDGCCCVK